MSFRSIFLVCAVVPSVAGQWTSGLHACVSCLKRFPRPKEKWDPHDLVCFVSVCFLLHVMSAQGALAFTVPPRGGDCHIDNRYHSVLFNIMFVCMHSVRCIDRMHRALIVLCCCAVFDGGQFVYCRLHRSTCSCNVCRCNVNCSH